MKKIQLSDFQKNLHNVMASVNRSFKSEWITDEGRLLVKIAPVSTSDRKSWLGCMNGTGKIIGDIISPAESLEAWEVLSERN